MSHTRAVTLLLLVIPFAAAFAQESDARPAGVVADFSKEPYTIERMVTRIKAESDGTGSREVSAEIRVLADAGVKTFAVLSFTYTSYSQAVEIDYVRVRKPDGTIVKTPDYNIQDMPSDVTRVAPLYSDVHEKQVAVKGLGVGDVLEYLVRYRIVKPEVPGQFWFEYSFVTNAVAKDEQLEINLPKDKYLKVVSPEYKPDIKEEGTRRTYRWTHANFAVKERDPNEIPRRVPPNPDVQVTTFSSWEEVGRWYGNLLKDPLQVTPAIRTKAAELTQGLTTDEEKTHALYNFVSLKYHYIGLDFGIGRYQPHAADDVLDNGYGDCKDKHTLLAALLQAVGIEAWPALIHTQRKLDAEVPSPAQFDHVITVVPRGSQVLWLDTTPEVAPYGLLFTNLRNRQALVIPTHNPPLLMTTPEDSPFPQKQEFSMEGKLAADGTFTGHAKQFYRGDAEVLLREAFRQVSQSQWKEAVQRFSYGLGFAGEVSNVKMTPPDDLDKPFELSYDYVRKKYGDWANRQITAPLPPMGVEFAKNTNVKKPSEPVLLGAASTLTYRSRLELPPGYTAVAPAKCHLTESYAEYSDDTRIENGVMTTTRQLVVKKREVPLNDWEGFKKFGSAVYDDEFNFIPLSRSPGFIEEETESDGKTDGADSEDVDRLFERGRDALQHQNARRAQELFEKVIAKDPRRREVHLNLAAALMAQNRPYDALAEFRKEEEISPGDPRSFQMAAAVASFTGNNDRAIAELRQLLKVAPENATTAVMLGGLLNEQGKYAEALEVLEAAVKTAPDSPGLQYQLGATYLKMGQNDKGVSYLREAAQSKDADPMVLNNVAYALAENKTGLDLAQQYGEQALKKVEERSLLEVNAVDEGTRVSYQLAMVWDTLGWVYFQSGDTNRSESFVRASWLLRQEPVVGEHLGEIYEKEGKNKPAAHAYELALAAAESWTVLRTRNSVGLPVPPGAYSSGREDLSKEIAARYQKLTGKKPSIRETLRLPNREWTKTVVEQLGLIRTVKLGKQGNLSGSAEFAIVFASGTVESVDYLSGAESLKALSGTIKAARFLVELPPGSQAKILRRAQVGCFPISGCTVVLMPPTP